MAVTTNLSINFLKRPAQKDLLAETRLIKLGKRLAVADIAIRSEGEDELVAHATSIYSIPPSHPRNGEIIPLTHPIEILSKYGSVAIDRDGKCG